MTTIKCVPVLVFWVYLPSLFNINKGGTAAELFGHDPGLSKQAALVQTGEKLQSLSERKEVPISFGHNVTINKQVAANLITHPTPVALKVDSPAVPPAVPPAANLTSRRNPSDRNLPPQPPERRALKKDDIKRKTKKRRKDGAVLAKSTREAKKKNKKSLKHNSRSSLKNSKPSTATRKKKRRGRQKSQALEEMPQREKSTRKGRKQNKNVEKAKKKKKRHGVVHNKRAKKVAKTKRKRKRTPAASKRRTKNAAASATDTKSVRSNKRGAKRTTPSDGADSHKKKRKRRQKGATKSQTNGKRSLAPRSLRKKSPSYGREGHPSTHSKRNKRKLKAGSKTSQKKRQGSRKTTFHEEKADRGKSRKRYGKKRLKRLEHVKQGNKAKRKRGNKWNKEPQLTQHGPKWRGQPQPGQPGPPPSQLEHLFPHSRPQVPPGIVQQAVIPGQTRYGSGVIGPMNKPAVGLGNAMGQRGKENKNLGMIPEHSGTGAQVRPGQIGTGPQKNFEFGQHGMRPGNPNREPDKRPPRQIEVQLKQPVRLTRPEGPMKVQQGG